MKFYANDTGVPSMLPFKIRRKKTLAKEQRQQGDSALGPNQCSLLPLLVLSFDPSEKGWHPKPNFMQTTPAFLGGDHVFRC